MLVVELLGRSCEVVVSWVKGHATRGDLQMGRTSEDKVGNDGADELAVAAAASHHVPSELVTSAKKRGEFAKRTQQIMIIPLERHRQEHSFEEVGPDRGSEADDDAVRFEDCMDCAEFVEKGVLPIPTKACVQSVAWIPVTNTHHVQD